MQSLTMQSQKVFYAGCTCLAIISTPLKSLAVTVEDVPNPRQANSGWVADTANLLSASTESKLNHMITQLEAKNGTEIAVVTVPLTAPSETPKAFATQLFNYWKIGKKAQNNGVLFLISKGDRRVEIETGYGIERVLPNAQVSEIIQQKILPPLKQNNFDQGTLNGTQALIGALETKTFRADLAELKVSNSPSALSPNVSQTSRQTGGFNWLSFIVSSFLGLLLLFGFIVLVHNISRDDDDDRGSGGGGRSRRASGRAIGGSTGAGHVGGSVGGSSGGGASGGFGGGASGGGGGGGGF